jgi:Flp pilus assembly protein TadG
MIKFLRDEQGVSVIELMIVSITLFFGAIGCAVLVYLLYCIGVASGVL